jgi:hypothetical protein
MADYCKGGAEAPQPLPSEFTPKGGPENLTRDGMAEPSSASDVNAALGAFAGLKKGPKLSSVTASGKADIDKIGSEGKRNSIVD